MRRTIAIIASSLLLSVGGFVLPSYVHADSASNNNATPSSAAPQADTGSFNGDKSGTVPVNPYVGTGDWLNSVMSSITSIFAWLLGISALALDYAMYYTVVGMGAFIHGLNAVGVTWRILRDLGNIVLIFGFVAAGIATIINVNLYGWSRKMIPMLILAAVFINFSLFFAEAVVDTGNMFATQVYKQINGGSLQTADNTGSVLGPQTSIGKGISDKIMASFGLQTIYGDAKVNPELFKGNNPLLLGMFASVLFLMLAFVFFSIAFVLVGRFVALIFILATAPLGFAGLAVPKLGGYASKWWSSLIDNAIVAPVLLVLLYIALRVITDTGFLAGFNVTNANAQGAWTGVVGDIANPGGYAGVLVSFIVAVALLALVVVQAKSMSTTGAALATRTAGRLTFGLTAFAGRKTLGRGSNYLARRLRSSRFGGTEAGRVIARGLDSGAKYSYDLRTPLKKTPLKQVDLGKVQEGGHAGSLKRATERRTDYAKSLPGRKGSKEERAKVAVAEGATKVAEKEHGEARDRVREAISSRDEKIKQRDELQKVEQATDARSELEALRMKLEENKQQLESESNPEKQSTIQRDIEAQEAHAEKLEERAATVPSDTSHLSDEQKELLEQLRDELKKGGAAQTEIDTAKEALKEAAATLNTRKGEEKTAKEPLSANAQKQQYIRNLGSNLPPRVQRLQQLAFGRANVQAIEGIKKMIKDKSAKDEVFDKLKKEITKEKESEEKEEKEKEPKEKEPTEAKENPTTE